MVNPIYQQGEELLLNQFGSKYLGVAAHTNVNSNEFIVQEDAVISVLTGGDSSTAANDVDYKASMSLSGVTLKQGALIVAPQGESFQSMTIDSGTIMAYNSVVGGTKPSAVPLLLDLYPDAAAAYSLRKLRTDYTGAAIEVRKTVGGETFIQDIGFVDGELDTESLLSFAEGGDVFVTKWYDQSGAGNNDAVQVSESAQPQIVSSGVVILENEKPAIEFDGNDHMPNGAGTSTPTNVSAFAVRGISSYPSIFRTLFNYKVFGLTYNSNGGAQYGNGAHIFKTTELAAKSDNYPTTTGQAIDVIINKTNLERNAFAANLDVGGVYADGASTIGSFSGTTQAFVGTIQELIIYESDKSENREAIKTNINTHYTIY